MTLPKITQLASAQVCLAPKLVPWEKHVLVALRACQGLE